MPIEFDRTLDEVRIPCGDTKEIDPNSPDWDILVKSQPAKSRKYKIKAPELK